jgi:hypothetical protein
VLTEAETTEVKKFRDAGGQIVTADAPDWQDKLKRVIASPSLKLIAPSTVRAVVRDQPGRTMIHLLNLNVERLSSFEDQVDPATKIRLTARVPINNVREVASHTADEYGTSGPVEFESQPEGDGSLLTITVPRLEINAIVVIE